MGASNEGAADARPSGADDGAIRILTYNAKMLTRIVRCGRADRRRARRIVAEVLAASPRYDVVCLQEVFAEDARELFAAGLAPALPHQVTKSGEGGRLSDDSGLFFAARFPIRGHDFRAFVAKAPLSPDALVDKGIFGARLDLGALREGLSLHVFNTHLQSDAAHREPRARQLEQARAFIAATLAPCPLETTCAVLAGDLNVVGDTSREYEQMTRRLDGARDLFREAEPEVVAAPGFTWDGRANRNMIPRGDTDRQRLDYLLALDAVPTRAAAPTPRRLRRLAVRTSAVVPFGGGPEDRLSDHFGVAATLVPCRGDW